MDGGDWMAAEGAADATVDEASAASVKAAKGKVYTLAARDCFEPVRDGIAV